MSRLALALGLASALLLGVSPASAQPSDPAHEVGEPLWMAGLSVFVATYVLTGLTTTTLVIVANGRHESIGESWIPVIGPFVMLADSAGFDVAQTALTAVSAALQVLGCAGLIVGIVLDAQPSPSGEASAELWLTPLLGPDGSGLSVGGRF